MLMCPVCQKALSIRDKSFYCEHNHCFDCGKYGDVNLLLPHQKRSKSPGDSRAMIAARYEFLSSGLYQPIAELLAKTIATVSRGEAKIIADAGCGDGYYLRQIQRLCYPHLSSFERNGGQFIGWDISKFATQRAAQRARGVFPATWLTASNANIPLFDDSVDILMCCFGFEVAGEFARIVKPQGYLITVDAGERHLLSLRETIYETIKPYREKPLLDEQKFTCVKTESLTYHITLNQSQVSHVMTMTPHLYRASYAGKEALRNVETLDTCVDVVVRIYHVI